MLGGSWYNMSGKIDPEQFPVFFFPNAIRLDFSSKIRARNVIEQFFSVVPRHWFIDAWFRCQKCNKEFCWHATEQRHWFEDLRFAVWSYPTLCPDCRKERQILRCHLRRYNTHIAESLRKTALVKLKREMLDSIYHIEELSENGLPDKMRRNKSILKKQLERKQN